MWTTQNRGRYNLDALGYPSDLTDAEWAPVEAPMPTAAIEATGFGRA